MSGSVVYLNLDSAMWTGDLKPFVLSLIPRAFTAPNWLSPPVLDNKSIRHQSSSNHCEVTFLSKEQADHFIKWISRNPVATDVHENDITMYAKPFAPPQGKSHG